MILTTPPRLVVLLSLLGTLSACAHPVTETTVPTATQATPSPPKPTDTTPKPAEPPQAEPVVRSDSTIRETDRRNRLADREQPIHIKADRIEINQRNSTTLYIGRVSLDRKSTRLNSSHQ